MADWLWVQVESALAAHEEQLAEHGGAGGVRDPGMLESAMARPLNLVAYGDPDAADLAASYAFGIARNHPFVDGNKRTAAVVSAIFLGLNGWELTCTESVLAATFYDLAAGKLTADELAGWFRRWTVRVATAEESAAIVEKIMKENGDILRELGD